MFKSRMYTNEIFHSVLVVTSVLYSMYVDIFWYIQ
nr:ALPV-050 [Albatrosspox virus]